MLVFFELDFHVDDFFILVDRLLVKLVGGFLVLLQFVLLDGHCTFHGFDFNAFLVEVGFVLALFGFEFLVEFFDFD